MILIVEDDVLIAEHLKAILLKEGFTSCATVNSYSDALSIINATNVQLVLLDINLGELDTGFDISVLLNEKKVPFIYISAQSDPLSQERIIDSKPLGFILKPFKPIEVSTAVKLFFNRFENRSLRLDDGKNKHLLDFEHIHYVQANRNYVEIIYNEQRLVVRKTLTEIEELLPRDVFCRTHRSYIVNKRHIRVVNQKELLIYEKAIPISQKYRESFDDL